jgi:hypothetical protein
MEAHERKSRCIECGKIKIVNCYSWKCDKCAIKNPEEKKLLSVMVESGKIINKKDN